MLEDTYVPGERTPQDLFPRGEFVLSVPPFICTEEVSGSVMWEKEPCAEKETRGVGRENESVV
mgnify:CR=1 FL=1